MRSVRTGLAALAACAAVLAAAGSASADVTVHDESEAPAVTIVFGDWVQFAGDDIFNAGHDNTVGSNN